MGALRAFWWPGRPSMNLGAQLQETANPQPAEIPESSGEQFPLYMVAPGGCATKTGKRRLVGEKGRKRDFSAAAPHRAQRADFFLGYHRIKTRRGTNRQSRHKPNGLRVARRIENHLSQYYCGRKCGQRIRMPIPNGEPGCCKAKPRTRANTEHQKVEIPVRGKLKLRK